jgi:hypothetical protein
MELDAVAAALAILERGDRRAGGGGGGDGVPAKSGESPMTSISARPNSRSAAASTLPSRKYAVSCIP